MVLLDSPPPRQAQPSQFSIQRLPFLAFQNPFAAERKFLNKLLGQLGILINFLDNTNYLYSLIILKNPHKALIVQVCKRRFKEHLFIDAAVFRQVADNIISGTGRPDK